MKWLRRFLTFALAVMPVSQSFAMQTDPMIEGAKLCTRHLPRYEREYAIPTNLLSAIASTESGRFHQGLGMSLPWPWSINAEGKSYFFNTKQDAIAAVRKLRAQGIQSIDVGCMQVNLYQHPNAFTSLNQAFEPQANIAYAAGFLRSLYDEGGSWKKAAAHYHSRTPSLGSQYVNKVYDNWYTIIYKLRAARLQVPESSIVAMNELKSPRRSVPHVHASMSPHMLHLASANSVKVVRPRQYAQLNENPPAYEPVRMNSIQVTSEADNSSSSSRESSNILVIPPADSASNPAPVVRAAEQTPPVMVVARANAPLTAAPTAAPVPAAAPADTLQASLQTPVQTLVADPVTGHVTDATAMSEMSPSAGRRSLAPPADQRTGPDFIFND